MVRDTKTLHYWIDGLAIQSQQIQASSDSAVAGGLRIKGLNMQ